MAVKLTIPGPVCRTDYNTLVKASLADFGLEMAGRIGRVLFEFRDHLKKEKKNFKLRVFIEGHKMVSLKVKGGLGAMTRTKYKVDEDKIERYDWRTNAWQTLFFIGEISFAILAEVSRVLPQASEMAPWFRAISCAAGIARRMTGGRNEIKLAIKCEDNRV
jgi:hypothetical protein